MKKAIVFLTIAAITAVTALNQEKIKEKVIRSTLSDSSKDAIQESCLEQRYKATNSNIEKQKFKPFNSFASERR